ncbi:MAG: UDP-3-O-[3-hydroxymyristoyl] N-acetylglucosamine deacetylase [Rhizobiales bacterium NRL2]|nr:MAG: UDP-3-O-[3-hydroxymyristoyl] N-acetylglucosamine deacetylase [Rhizobiales bacterium NRL2]
MSFQKTIAKGVERNGVGLHSGVDVRLALRPAPANTGVVFRRTDLEGDAAVIPARFDHVADTRLCTAIANADGASVATIEHVMSALSGMEIDNCFVDVSGPETPVMDGSAAPFVEMIREAGIKQQDMPRRVIRILREVRVGDDRTWARLSPADEFRLSFNIAFDNALLAAQSTQFHPGFHSFEQDVARARTFCLYEEIEGMWAAGLAKGGSLDNAVVVQGDKVLNPEGLRYEDESVRHKALDAIGDLYTAGHRIVGAYHGERAGHGLNNRLLKALFADRANYVIEQETADWEELRLVDAAD